MAVSRTFCLLSSVVLQLAAIASARGFNYSTYCNDSSYDSMALRPHVDLLSSAAANVTATCFDANEHDADAGLADGWITGKFVFDQFENMTRAAALCQVKTVSDDPNAVVDKSIAVESKSLGQWTTGETLSDRQADSSKWIESTLALDNVGPVEFVQFVVAGRGACVKRVLIACNNGASNGFGNAAVSLGRGYFEHQFETRGVLWEACGPEGSGVRPAQSGNFAFRVYPQSMSGDWSRLMEAVQLTVD